MQSLESGSGGISYDSHREEKEEKELTIQHDDDG